MKVHARRSGTTLVELVMGLVIVMIVVALAVAHTVRHQRAYAAVESAADLRSRLRDGSDILSADLRGNSAAGDGLLVALDTAVEFSSVVGTSTLCAVPAANVIVLPPDSLASGRILTSWIAPPEQGDYVLLFTDSSAAAPAQWRRWRVESVSPVSSGAACPVASGLLRAIDVAGSAPSYSISLESGASVTASRGAPVRVVRHVRYSVYRGGDGKWYLGYRRCDAVCAAIQPVSGPYEATTGTPVSFRYFNREGNPVTAAAPTFDVARVEIVSRGTYDRALSLSGAAVELFRDSGVVSVALRNTW